jgi:hypothetical protein
MYTKKILSAATAVAIMTTGAMAFDYTKDGEIVADITKASLNASKGVRGLHASYVGGVEAGSVMMLSDNSKGDALIYPAFKAGDGWGSKISVRNAENNATVCKVVLYADDNSREILDFDIYLSPYDVFTFNIEENGDVTTSDGSFALVDPTFNTDKHRFLKHNKETLKIGNIRARSGNENLKAGYAIVYAMVEAENDAVNEMRDGHGAYHGDHSALFRDFRKLLDICRDIDNNLTTVATWRTVLNSNSANIQNGTAVGGIDVLAPNVESDCTDIAIATRNDKDATKKLVKTMKSRFTSPSSDLLFGDITISSKGTQPRNLLLKARAIDNYTANNQMMLWVPGEYAAIQDRRITNDTQADARNTNGFAVSTRAGYSDYNLTGIEQDALTFVKSVIYYTFDANKLEGSNTILITQPMKRALVMANNRGSYWTGTNAISNRWGQFVMNSQYYNENENLDVAATSLIAVISPVSGDPADAYKNELQVINDPERTETASEIFAKSEEAGFAIMSLRLPAIATQMVGSMVDGKGQINWIYSTTDK